MTDYEVGYGKPPKPSQFPPGRSGNPAGRKAGSRGLKTDLAAELDARHTIQINKQPVSGTRQVLMIRTLAIRAASGDLKAQQVLLPLVLQILGIEDRGIAKEKLSVSDQAILDELLGGASDPVSDGDDEPADSDDDHIGDPEPDHPAHDNPHLDAVEAEWPDEEEE